MSRLRGCYGSFVYESENKVVQQTKFNTQHGSVCPATRSRIPVLLFKCMYNNYKKRSPINDTVERRSIIVGYYFNEQ